VYTLPFYKWKLGLGQDPTPFKRRREFAALQMELCLEGELGLETAGFVELEQAGLDPFVHQAKEGAELFFKRRIFLGDRLLERLLSGAHFRFVRLVVQTSFLILQIPLLCGRASHFGFAFFFGHVSSD
jgi:hypothetical protein